MTIVEQQAGALLVAADPFFDRSRDQITALAARFKVPAIYESREFVVAGGLISYGASVATAYHEAGIYIGKILKGAKPADLPSNCQLSLNCSSTSRLLKQSVSRLRRHFSPALMKLSNSPSLFYLTTNFASLVSGGVDIDIPFARHQIFGLSVGECG